MEEEEEASTATLCNVIMYAYKYCSDRILCGRSVTSESHVNYRYLTLGKQFQLFPPITQCSVKRCVARVSCYYCRAPSFVLACVFFVCFVCFCALCFVWVYIHTSASIRFVYMHYVYSFKCQLLTNDKQTCVKTLIARAAAAAIKKCDEIMRSIFFSSVY